QDRVQSLYAAAPAPNPDRSTPAGSFTRGKGERTPPAGSSRHLRCAAEGGGRGGAGARRTTMTAHRDLKRIIRARREKTGESYTATRAHVMRERAALLGLDADASTEPARADAAVLKVNRQSARVRILGEEGQITFRPRDVWDVVPGHLVTLVIENRWTWRDDAYASGRIVNPRIAVDKPGLVPLPL